MASTKVDWGQYADEQDKLTSKVNFAVLCGRNSFDVYANTMKR